MPNPESGSDGDEGSTSVHDHNSGQDIVDNNDDASAHIADESPQNNQKSAVDNESSEAPPSAATQDSDANAEPEPVPVEPKIELLYTPPPWSTPPHTPYYFEVREGEDVVEKVPVNIKGHYLIGRLPICDIVVDDATCSRQHAIVQFRPGDPDPQTGKRQDEVYIYDLGSTSGTYVNGMPLQAKAYYPLYKGDILQFGQYSCAFVLRDGSEPGSIPPEGNGVVNPDINGNPSAEDRPKTFDLSMKNIDPTDSAFDEDAYKQAMIEKYMQQQRENEEILKRRKERLAQGLPPDEGDGIPEVKPVPVSSKGGKADKKKGGKEKKKGGKDKEDCIIS